MIQLYLLGYRLPSYNRLMQNMAFARSAWGRRKIQLEIKALKQHAGKLLFSADNKMALQQCFIRYPLHITTIYAKSGKAYDHPNALISLDKFIIDTMVQLGIIPDDDPAHVTYGEIKYVKCKRGKEYVILNIESGSNKKL